MNDDLWSINSSYNKNTDTICNYKAVFQRESSHDIAIGKKSLLSAETSN